MPVFLFTDIERSTERWAQYPQEMETALARHDALLKERIEQHGGKMIKHTGDGIFAVFEGGAPLACALEIQQELNTGDWSAVGGPLQVRLALHMGEARQREADFFGLEVSRTARLLSAGWGGQILLTCELARTADLPPEATLRDMGNHLLKDLSEPQHLYQLLHPDLPRLTFPPLRTLSAHPNNLPPQPTPFVGRDGELREILLQMANPTCRLLTLIGPGGMGKTRLALRAAAEQIEAFPHGVYFVPLAPLTSGAQLEGAIAEVLHFSFYEREEPRAQLLKHLKNKELLLLLDNFEHVLDGVLLVTEILACAPAVKILATSRERLRLREEQIFPIAGMSFPTGPGSALETFAAVRLFMQHAQQADPTFQLDIDRRDAIARICAHVEGMPLALELAASWLRVLSCAEVASELEQSLDLLSTSLRDVPDRHRSLRAVFEYSWQLLSLEEQQALSALSIFQGDFCRQAAATILASAPPAARTTLNLLAALVDKSLLQRRPNDRYAMHRLLHDYALEKLLAEPDREAPLRQRHCAYYAAFLRNQLPTLESAAQQEALDAIAHVFEDVRAAWRWAVKARDHLSLEAMTPALSTFLAFRGRQREGVRLFGAATEALTGLPDAAAKRARGVLLTGLASLLIDLNRLDEGQSAVEEALDLLRPCVHPTAMASALDVLGRVAWTRGEYATAAEQHQTALALHTETGNLNALARSHDHLGTTAWAIGNYTAARKHFEQALALFRHTGDPSGITATLDHLGVVARDEGDYQTALTAFQESYERCQTLGHPIRTAYVANHLGGILALKEGLAKAEPYFEQCLAIGREIGEQRIVAYTLSDWGMEVKRAGDLDRSRAMHQESLALFQEIGDPFGVITAQMTLASCVKEAGEPAAAWDLYRAALHTAQEIQSERLIACSLIGWAALLEDAGDAEQALVIVGLAETLPGDATVTDGLAQTLVATLRQTLPPATFAAALECGRNADLTEVITTLLALPNPWSSVT